jgi:hypothetical protein
MNKKILNLIRGRRISGFSFVTYGNVGLERVIMHMESSQTFQIKSKEIAFGSYEADTLEVIDCGETAGVERVDADWTVGTIDVFERQDWLEPAGTDIKTIGNNPTTHTWGAVGSAPTRASHTTIVISSITFISDKRDRQAMVYLANYPGLVCFTTDAREMASVRKAHGGT